MIEVCYAGPFLDASGYGEATRNAIKALHTAGANIMTQKIAFTGKTTYDGVHAKLAEELSTRKVDYKMKILHVTPDLYPQNLEKGKYNIGHLFWETDKLPQSWVVPCNMMDEIWTGTEINKKAIKDSGVTTPVYVYPQSIRMDIPDVKPFVIPGFDHGNSFLFYSIFEWIERKNPKTLLNAFWKEFKDDNNVGLLLKVHIGSYSPDSVKQIVNEARRLRNETGFAQAPLVYLCTNILSREEIHRIHETGDCFVSSHRGEGWGLPQAEAALHARHIISTPYGGIHEYFSNRQMRKIKFDMVPVDKVYGKYYEPGMNWAQADEKDLRKAMREIFEKWMNPKIRGLSKVTGASAKKAVMALFNYETVGKQMLERLKQIDLDLKGYDGK